MNSLKDLEPMLRGLTLRPPSDRVRAALFGLPPATATATAAAVPEDALPPARLLQAWFAPLAATGVLLLSLATVWLPATEPSGSRLAIASLAGRWEGTLAQVERNALPRPSFRSTTAGAVASSFGSLLLRQTNVLAR